MFFDAIPHTFDLLTALLGSRQLAAGVGLVVVAILFLGPGFFRHWRCLWMSPLLLLAPFPMTPSILGLVTGSVFWLGIVFFATLWRLFLLFLFVRKQARPHKVSKALKVSKERTEPKRQRATDWEPTPTCGFTINPGSGYPMDECDVVDAGGYVYGAGPTPGDPDF